MLKILHVTDTHYGCSGNTHKIHRKFFLKLQKENFDAIVHTGDWGIVQPDQFQRSMKMFREYFPDKPILAVRGNHDFWQGTLVSKRDSYSMWKKFRRDRIIPYGELLSMHKEWFKEFNIHHLEKNPYVTDDVIIYGYDGWYHSNPDKYTRDSMYLWNDIEGCPIHSYLAHKAYNDLDWILQHDPGDKKVVIATHFPPFPYEKEGGMHDGSDARYKDFIAGKADLCLTGHYHYKTDFVHNDCRFFSIGGDYDEPAFSILSI